ncbi:MAG TPA: hypothetical protein VK168_19745 [Saprospiraceae bacterium]|nr:hypothetical protein [Saprospiraceae bacterium]
MRKIFLLSSLFLLKSLAISAQKSSPASNIYDLKDAIAQKLVSVKVEGKGGHQGETLKLVCKNLRGKYLRLRIPQGQLMEPADSAQQTLVVSTELLLAVTAKTPVEATLQTFCTQAGEMSPKAAEVFAIGAMAPAQLCNLLKFMAEKGKTDSPDAQTAVWCLLSGRSLGSIGDPELTKFVAEQLGKNVPAYKVKHRTVEYLPGERAELGKALVVEANFTYFLEKDERVLMVLLDSAGKQIKQVSKEELMKAGEHRTGLRLEVYNLNSDKYTLRMQTKSGKVIKDMEVEF